MMTYLPRHRMIPQPLPDVDTAWKEVTPVIESILEDFQVGRDTMIEFGVDKGYSSAVFSHFFRQVIGVDHFKGDIHAGLRGDSIYPTVKETLKPYPNVFLLPMTYDDFCVMDMQVDFIHVDIVHTYIETFECGNWSVRHAPIVMFHDTMAFPEVMQAVKELAYYHNSNFYHIPEQHGIGLLVRRDA